MAKAAQSILSGNAQAIVAKLQEWVESGSELSEDEVKSFAAQDQSFGRFVSYMRLAGVMGDHLHSVERCLELKGLTFVN